MASPAVLTLTPADAEVAIGFRQLHRPWGDDVTRFEVVVEGAGLAAATWATTTGGDVGFHTDGGGRAVGLGHLLRSLGQAASPWPGTRGWSAMEGLRLDLRCARTGHVTVGVTTMDREVDPRWTVSATFVTTLGDLVRLAADVDAWVCALD